MIENCPMRHENGNCIPAGGFCTANKNICEALLNAYRMGKAQLSQEGTTKDTTSDLISRMKTVERLRGVVDVTVPITDYDGGYIDGIETGISIVSTMPTIQPEPHEGHWIGSDGSYICSECNGDPLDFIDTMGASCDAYVETLMKFCPNCGAKMSNQNKIKGERQK